MWTVAAGFVLELLLMRLRAFVCQFDCVGLGVEVTVSLNDVCMSMFRSCFCIGREKCWRRICVPSVVGLSCRELIFGCGEFGECISCMCMLGLD